MSGDMKETHFRILQRNLDQEEEFRFFNLT